MQIRSTELSGCEGWHAPLKEIDVPSGDHDGRPAGPAVTRVRAVPSERIVHSPIGVPGAQFWQEKAMRAQSGENTGSLKSAHADDGQSVRRSACRCVPSGEIETIAWPSE